MKNIKQVYKVHAFRYEWLTPTKPEGEYYNLSMVWVSTQ